MVSIQCSNCSLYGSIPTSVMQLRAVAFLSLADNPDIQGPLPEAKGRNYRAPSWTVVDLSNLPALSGEVPNSWGDINTLINLNLTGSTGLRASDRYHLPTWMEISNQFRTYVYKTTLDDGPHTFDVKFPLITDANQRLTAWLSRVLWVAAVSVSPWIRRTRRHMLGEPRCMLACAG